MKNYVEDIKEAIRALDGSEIQDLIVDDQEMISFLITVNEKNQSIALFHREFEEQGQLMLQLFTSFPAIYDEPGADFYKVLERFNLNSIIGHIFFSQEEEIYRISYKSNSVSSLDKSSGPINIKIFLEASMLMVNEFERQLNVI